jgi:hypothetical protein
VQPLPRIRSVYACLLAATALLLAACATPNCGPCQRGVRLAIVDARPDPARVLWVCVDGYPTCPEIRIEALPSPSPDYGRDTHSYRCTTTVQGTVPVVDCEFSEHTAYLTFHQVAPKDASRWRVEVTATGGRLADEHVSGQFKYRPKEGPCGCASSFAEVHLTPAS